MVATRAADPPAATEGRIAALDGLRGVAILLVLLFHTTVVRTDGPLEALLHGLFRNFGWAGVDLFFVLSGFLITGVLADTRGGPRSVRNFYARRVLRIFPVYYAFLILVFAVAPRIGPEALTVGDDAIFYWLYLQNFATAVAGDWTHSRALNLFWSLAIEEQFYLVWPWVMLATTRRRLMRICAALVAGSLALRIVLVAADVAPVAVYVLTPTRLDGLAVGAWLALAARGGGGLGALVVAARRVAFLVAAALVVLVGWQRGFGYMLPGTLTVGLTLLALGFGALLVLAVESEPASRLRRVLESGLLRRFGRYSYTLFVIHQAVLVLGTRLLVERVFDPYAPGAHVLVFQAALYAVVGGVSFALAALIWRFYETPFLSLKRYFRAPAASEAEPGA